MINSELNISEEAPGLSEEDLVSMYRYMLLARLLDERFWELARQGRVRFAVPHSGHEAFNAGFAFAIKRGIDYASSHYRALAALLVIGLTPREIACAQYSKAPDPGSGGILPYSHWSCSRLKITSIAGPQPNHLTHAVGVALGCKIEKEAAVTWASCGDGGASKGEWHEALNFAAIHRLPMVFSVETNGYTQSVPLRLQSANPEIYQRAQGYAIPGYRVDGFDPLAVYRIALTTLEAARAGKGPSLVEATLYRFFPNTSNDNDMLYRSSEEVQRMREKDPLPVFRDRLIRAGLLSETVAAELITELTAQVSDAITFAESAAFTDPAVLFQHVYATRDRN